MKIDTANLIEYVAWKNHGEDDQARESMVTELIQKTQEFEAKISKLIPNATPAQEQLALKNFLWNEQKKSKPSKKRKRIPKLWVEILEG